MLADRLLMDLFEETKRLIGEKEYAVHAVAGALLERGELIGPELDEIFKWADEANPDQAGPFERSAIELPRPFEREGRAPVTRTEVAQPIAAHRHEE